MPEGPLLNSGCLMLLVMVCGGPATMPYGLGVLIYGAPGLVPPPPSSSRVWPCQAVPA
ncbi:hypothetical protein [Streptomyces sp. NPDC059378]|uniref:hypothetical protein n=1 Tax=Streptomyces sp. NPDC059378 TaxID=3346815 RepID=UPI0036C431A1